MKETLAIINTAMTDHSVLHRIIPGFFCSLMVLTSCEGPPGADANSTCIQCHNSSSVIVSMSEQWKASVHASGANIDRNAATCAMCHTSEGFRECIATGKTVTAAAIQNPSSIGCRTCHRIHESYDTTDWEIRTKLPVTLMISGEVVNQGKGNLCVNCHQPRIPDPLPVLNGNSITIRSPYWGPHHSTQAAVVSGVGGVPFTGTVSYENSAHSAITNGCVTCHMASAVGNKSGGHTMKIAYQSHGNSTFNLAGCTGCHSNTAELSNRIMQTQCEIDSLLNELSARLLAHSILKPDGQINASSSSPLDLTSTQAGALLNYLLIKEDRSGGLHNYKYTKALLKNSIEQL